MMRTIKKMLMTAAVLLCCVTATAHDFEVDGIYYNIKSANKKTVEVTYKGSNYSQYENEYIGYVVVPAMVSYNDTSYDVTDIGQYAFRDCTGLKSVKIPNSVTYIGMSAFSSCTGLESVNIPAIIASGNNLFYGCTGLKRVEVNCSSLSDFFKGNTSIEELILGDNVKSISNNALSGCTGLTSITIPNSVTYIGESAFQACHGLTNVIIGNNVATIGSGAFRNCGGLTNIEIPNSVTRIMNDAFSGCI